MAKGSKSDTSRARTIRWDGADFEKIEKAAELLQEKHGYSVTATEVIRRGAVRHAEDILGAA